VFFDDDGDEGGMSFGLVLGMGRGCSDYPHLCLDENKQNFTTGIHGDAKQFPNDKSRFRPNGIWHGSDPEYV